METNVSYSAHLNKVAIDSLRLLLPFDKVENESNLEIESVRVNLETGEAGDKDILKSESRDFPDTKAKIQFGIVEPLQGNKKVGEKMYYLKVNAKFLGDRYLEGITSENLSYIYEQSQKIKQFLKFSEDTFRNAKYTDTDFKYDVFQDIDTSRQIVKSIYNQTPDENRKYVQEYNNKTNLGIAFNDRAKAKPKHPFLKWYSKLIELNRPENLWLRDTLMQKFGVIIEILRYEFSMKNNATWKQNGLTKPETFEKLCVYSQSEELKRFILDAPDKYYLMTKERAKTMKPKTEDGLIESPIEFMLRAMAEDHLDNGKGRNYFLNIVERYEKTYGITKDDKRPRRLQAMIKTLLEGMDTPEQKKKIKISTAAEEYLKQFGIF